VNVYLKIRQEMNPILLLLLLLLLLCIKEGLCLFYILNI